MNGQVHYPSPTAQVYQSVVNVTCDPGFHIMSSESRTCLSNGTWSGEEPVCSCKSPEDVYKLDILISDFHYTLIFVCVNIMQ